MVRDAKERALWHSLIDLAGHEAVSLSTLVQFLLTTHPATQQWREKKVSIISAPLAKVASRYRAPNHRPPA
jgi:hypothetical protein